MSASFNTILNAINMQARIQKFFKGGGVGGKFLKEKCLLIHVSTRVNIKTRQMFNSFSLLPFQEDCLLFFSLLLSFIFEILKGGGVATLVIPPLDPPM